MSEPTDNDSTQTPETSTAAAASENEASSAPAKSPPVAEEPVSEPPKPDLFHLIVDKTDHASPHLRFSWCLKPEGIAELRRNNVRYPYLLVVVAKEREKGDWRRDIHGLHKEVDRFMVPLDQAYGTYEFSHPGEFTLLSTIVWSSKERGGKAMALEQLREIMRRDNMDDFVYHGLTGGTIHPNPAGCNRVEFVDSIGVKIDESLFAAKPPDWWWNWVNLWHEGAPKNQCIFRRRAMLSVPKVVPALCAIVWHTFFRLLFVPTFLLSGWHPKSISLRPLLHPFRMRVDGIHSGASGFNYARRLSKHGHYDRTRLEAAIRMPITWILAYAAGFMVEWRYGHEVSVVLHALAHVGIWMVLGIFHLVRNHFVFALCTLAGLAIFVYSSKLGYYAHKLWKKYHALKTSETLEALATRRLLRERQDAERMERETLEHEARERLRREAYYTSRLEPLACANADTRDTKKVSVAALPATHRTLIVRFLELKSNVCLPFSRGG